MNQQTFNIFKSAKTFYASLIICIVSSITTCIAFACTGDDVPVVGTENYFPLVYGDYPTQNQLMTLGKKIFFDTSLSASGKLACASCHSPAKAFGPPNQLAIQFGGEDLTKMGFRNTPSLTYLHSPINFTEHFIEPEVTGAQDDEGPTGGRTWDGRVNKANEQALMPLLDPNEMANKDKAEIVARLQKTIYAEEFRKAFSPPDENIFDNTDAAVAWLTVALETFEQSPAEFHSFTSKYDAYLRDQVQLTPQESLGLALFNDPKKGNCVSCHPSGMKSSDKRPPILTDFGFIAAAAPRNLEIPANRNPNFFDMGLCGPQRRDLSNKPEYCGSFRTPSLRNVALRQRFFHNGVFHSLRDVVDFYATRETNPEKWYPKNPDGTVNKYNDLPKQYHKYINNDVPFLPLPNGQPRLNNKEIDAIVAFMQTLTDGYSTPKTIAIKSAKNI